MKRYRDAEPEIRNAQIILSTDFDKDESFVREKISEMLEGNFGEINSELARRFGKHILTSDKDVYGKFGEDIVYFDAQTKKVYGVTLDEFKNFYIGDWTKSKRTPMSSGTGRLSENSSKKFQTRSITKPGYQIKKGQAEEIWGEKKEESESPYDLRRSSKSAPVGNYYEMGIIEDLKEPEPDNLLMAVYEKNWDSLSEEEKRELREKFSVKMNRLDRLKQLSRDTGIPLEKILREFQYQRYTIGDISHKPYGKDKPFIQTMRNVLFKKYLTTMDSKTVYTAMITDENAKKIYKAISYDEDVAVRKAYDRVCKKTVKDSFPRLRDIADGRTKEFSLRIDKKKLER